MNQHLILHKDAMNFILAGNSLFTVKNIKSEKRFTFKVTKHKKDNIYFVRILTNPNIYEFIGTLKDDSYKHSLKSKISSSAQSVIVFNYIINRLLTNTLPDIIEIWHEGKCGKCGRSLTDPDSIQMGFGPFCLNSIRK